MTTDSVKLTLLFLCCFDRIGLNINYCAANNPGGGGF